MDIDRYDRVVGMVNVGDVNVNEALAIGFDNEPYWKAEAQAKTEKLNIWSLGEDYV